MLSIIIPTLNEAATLSKTVRHTVHAAQHEPIEIIVSDCDSRDRTVQVARGLDLRTVRGGNCRASALNAGADVARGNMLLFLHADSILPHGFAQTVSHALHDPRDIVGGAFDFAFDDPDPTVAAFAQHCLHWVVLCNRIRYRWTGNFYGDQCIFVRRDVFDAVGGFPQVELMEDIAFCQRLHRFGRTAILRPPVLTSPRRFLDHGVIRQFIQDLTLLTCACTGVRPMRLWDRYNEWNHRAGWSAVAPRTASPAAGAA
jgi:rSAM/selenodomain-associated transferase 2